MTHESATYKERFRSLLSVEPEIRREAKEGEEDNYYKNNKDAVLGCFSSGNIYGLASALLKTRSTEIALFDTGTHIPDFFIKICNYTKNALPDNRDGEDFDQKIKEEIVRDNELEEKAELRFSETEKKGVLAAMAHLAFPSAFRGK